MAYYIYLVGQSVSRNAYIGTIRLLHRIVASDRETWKSLSEKNQYLAVAFSREEKAWFRETKRLLTWCVATCACSAKQRRQQAQSCF